VRLGLAFGLTPNTLRNFQESVASLRFSIVKKLRLIFIVETDLHDACSVTMDDVKHHVELIQQTTLHALASQPVSDAVVILGQRQGKRSSNF
jgi:hypothetical protein